MKWLVCAVFNQRGRQADQASKQRTRIEQLKATCIIERKSN